MLEVYLTEIYYWLFFINNFIKIVAYNPIAIILDTMLNSYVIATVIKHCINEIGFNEICNFIIIMKVIVFMNKFIV